MKYILFLLLITTTIAKAQSNLKYNKRNVECEDKWITYQMDKDSTYSYGFIYIDSQAGLTLNYEGKFKIDKNGTFIKYDNGVNATTTSIKVRLEPNRIAIAEIPESKFKDLKIEKFPSWLKYYKDGENTIEHYYRWGFLYNSYGECEKAITYLEKANAINPNFKGLQTEMAYSYNALEQFDKAEYCLKVAIADNPKDCYTFKELAYTYNSQRKFKKVAETYDIMTKNCSEKEYIQETAHNLAYEYFKLKDKTNFKIWKKNAVKWSTQENKFTQNLDHMEKELN